MCNTNIVTTKRAQAAVAVEANCVHRRFSVICAFLQWPRWDGVHGERFQRCYHSFSYLARTLKLVILDVEHEAISSALQRCMYRVFRKDKKILQLNCYRDDDMLSRLQHVFERSALPWPLNLRPYSSAYYPFQISPPLIVLLTSNGTLKSSRFFETPMLRFFINILNRQHVRFRFGLF